MSSLKSSFWDAIEKVYGEVDKFIKIVLQVNGFNSFLALKGIRYDDKNEFFSSLELTVIEILQSCYDSLEKSELEAELMNQHQTADNFRLRPGHRNFIMNLMMEVESTDFESLQPAQTSMSHRKLNEFFETLNEDGKTSNSKQSAVTEPTSPSQLIVRRSNSSQAALNQVDHVYSREDEYVVEEEEYLTEDTMDSTGRIKIEYESGDHDMTLNTPRKKKPSTPSSTRRRPDQMYNEEFMAKCVNPRKRRVTLSKTYPPTDEGTRERFVDLIQQSLRCILPTEKLAEIENAEIAVEKETESSWAVYCPLCCSRIRLPVVRENQGRYFNYKRSNFERHLRFKHCKLGKRSEVYETVNMIEEVIE